IAILSLWEWVYTWLTFSHVCSCPGTRDLMKSDDLRKISDAPTIGTPGGPTSSGTAGAAFGGAVNSAAIFDVGYIVGNRFEILEVLGTGGMGSVYKAYDHELERFVALKTIRPELAGDAEMLRRFKQELVLAREIAHRNIVRLYDIFDGAGAKFLTMEYIEGEHLGTVLERQGKLAPAEAVQVMQQICVALDAAHS